MTLTIEGELCDLNNYISAERSRRIVAAKIKREETERVSWEAVGAGLPHVTKYPVWLTYTWYSKERADRY